MTITGSLRQPVARLTLITNPETRVQLIQLGIGSKRTGNPLPLLTTITPATAPPRTAGLLVCLDAMFPANTRIRDEAKTLIIPATYRSKDAPLAV